MSENNQVTTAQEFFDAVAELTGFNGKSWWSADFERFIDELDDENSAKGYYFHPHEFMSGDINKDQKTTFRGAELVYVTRKGGGEGGAQDCYTVFTVFGQHFRVDYNYFSHEGYNFEGASIQMVNPVVRPVTFYE